MKVNKEELLKIAELADLNIKDEEIENYLANLQDILNFTEVINSANVEGLEETIGANENCNVFRKDVVKEFDNKEGLMQNAPEKEKNMYKIPKVL